MKTEIILLLYFMPMFISLFFCYKDDDIKTIGDLLNQSGWFLIPFVNIFVCLMIPIYYLTKFLESKKINVYFDKIKNTKIK